MRQWNRKIFPLSVCRLALSACLPSWRRRRADGQGAGGEGKEAVELLNVPVVGVLIGMERVFAILEEQVSGALLFRSASASFS